MPPPTTTSGPADTIGPHELTIEPIITAAAVINIHLFFITFYLFVYHIDKLTPQKVYKEVQNYTGIRILSGFVLFYRKEAEICEATPDPFQRSEPEKS